MYAIRMTLKLPVDEKKKGVLFQAAAEADADAKCREDGAVYEIRGSSLELEKLSYLLGLAVGCLSSDKIEKLSVVFEK